MIRIALVDDAKFCQHSTKLIYDVICAIELVYFSKANQSCGNICRLKSRLFWCKISLHLKKKRSQYNSAHRDRPSQVLANGFQD